MKKRPKIQGAVFHNLWEIDVFDDEEYDEYDGYEPEPIICEVCNGSGEVVLFLTISECTECSGSGYFYR